MGNTANVCPKPVAAPASSVLAFDGSLFLGKPDIRLLNRPKFNTYSAENPPGWLLFRISQKQISHFDLILSILQGKCPRI